MHQSITKQTLERENRINWHINTERTICKRKPFGEYMLRWIGWLEICFVFPVIRSVSSWISFLTAAAEIKNVKERINQKLKNCLFALAKEMINYSSQGCVTKISKLLSRSMKKFCILCLPLIRLMKLQYQRPPRNNTLPSRNVSLNQLFFTD